MMSVGSEARFFMGKIAKDPLMRPSKMLYLLSQGSSGIVIKRLRHELHDFFGGWRSGSGGGGGA